MNKLIESQGVLRLLLHLVLQKPLNDASFLVLLLWNLFLKVLDLA